jgi:hypothetical protein
MDRFGYRRDRRCESRRPAPGRRIARCIAFACLLTGSAVAEEIDELLDFDLATLMDMEVITPARKGQTVYEEPASVTVISRETPEVGSSAPRLI